MKKISFLVVAIVACVVANAQNSYKHGVGVVVGNLEGFSYKYFLTENLAIQADLGFKAISSGVGSYTYNGKMTYTDGTITKLSSADADPEDLSSEYPFEGWTLEVNPNLVYQKPIKDFGWGNLSWFAGAGLSLGLGKYCTTYWWDAYYHHYGSKTNSDRGSISGKFGLNAVGGVELLFSKLPIAVGVDFRPGYGLFFDHVSRKYNDYKLTGNNYAHMFDWTVGVSARWCF